MTSDRPKPIKQQDSDRLKPIDILADYRYWRSRQEDRIGTHSPECHVWPRHERCMIHRLARELEKTRAALAAVATQEGTLSVSDGTTPGKGSKQEQGTCPKPR